MADARAREQLRQERAAFEQASRHNKAWFVLRLTMGYLGLAILPVILVMAIWVLSNPQAYGPVPIGAAAVAMTSQAFGVSFGIVRLVLQQRHVVRLDPLTLTTATIAGARTRQRGYRGATKKQANRA